MKTLKKILGLVLVLSFLITAAACDGTTQVGNPDAFATGEAVTMQLNEDGSVDVSLPLAALSLTEADLDTVTIDAKASDEYLVVGLNADDSYNDNLEAIEFTVDGRDPGSSLMAFLSSGQSLTVIVNNNSEEEATPFTAELETDSEEEAESSTAVEVNGMSTIVDATCERLSACFSGFSEADCSGDLLENESFGNMFLDVYGEPTDPGETVSFNDILADLDSEAYSVDESDVSSCVSAIESLDCSTVESASDETGLDVEPEGIENIVPDACQQIVNT